MSDDPVWTSSLQPNDTQPASRPVRAPIRTRPIGLYLLTGCLALIVLMCATTSLVLASIGPSTLLSLRDRWLGHNIGEAITTIGQVAQVIVANNDVWPIPNNGRLNVLLMGVDSRDKQVEGANRSDVVTLVSIDPGNHTAAIFSIPRDLYVPLPGLNEQNRINTAYFWGEYNKLLGGGPGYAEKTIEYNFGIPLQRYAVIDFAGFKQVIDAIGGVDIDVPSKIVDNAYPTDDYGIERLVIPAGHLHMDGDLALKYVRTRHPDSDFGRLQRQQQVLLAIRDKALSIGSIDKVPEALNALGDSLITDFTLPELLTLARKWAAIPRENIHTYRIDETMVQPWVTPDGGQVLLPNRELIAGVVAQFLGNP